MPLASPQAFRPGATLKVYVVSAGITVLVAAPVVAGWVVDWSVIGALFLIGAAGASAATVCQIAVYYSWRHALLGLLLALAVAWPAEAAGIRWGFPFSAPYEYHPALRPALPGGLPMAIPLAWLVMFGMPLVLLRGMGAPLAIRAALAGLTIVAIDLLLEPTACAMGLWTWRSGGAYFDSPPGNLAGWWLVGFVFHAAFGLLGRRLARADAPPSRTFDAVWAGVNLLCLALASAGATMRTGHPLPTFLSLAILAPLWYRWFVGPRGTRTAN